MQINYTTYSALKVGDFVRTVEDKAMGEVVSKETRKNVQVKWPSGDIELIKASELIKI